MRSAKSDARSVGTDAVVGRAAAAMAVKKSVTLRCCVSAIREVASARKILRLMSAFNRNAKAEKECTVCLCVRHVV